MKKILVLGAVLLVGTTSALAYSASGDSITVQESLQTQLIPPAMKTESNVQAISHHFGFDLNTATATSAHISLSLKGTEKNGTLTGLVGHGAIQAGNQSYSIAIQSNQHLKNSTLSNEHRVYYGLVEAVVQGKSGVAPLNLGVLYDSVTKEAQVTVVAGDMSVGIAPLLFGEALKDIPQEEISELVRNE